MSVADRRSRLAEFKAALRQGMEDEFLAFGYPIMSTSVEAVHGNRIELSDGKPLEFDRLICATGNEYRSDGG
jgi:thioredoxin reductase